MKFRLFATVATIGLAGAFGIPQFAQAQTAPDQQAQAAPAPAAPAAAAPAAPASNAVSTPAMGGTITADPNPFSVDLGPLLGKTWVTGQVTGMAFAQTNPVPAVNGVSIPTLTSGYAGNKVTELDLSNGMAEIQKTDGMIQYYVQAGAYSLPVVGVPYVDAAHLNGATFGPVPIAYLKYVPTDSLSIEVGKLPTLIGQEGTFTFQNLNIERGLLWNQENVINRGIQVNYTVGPVALAGSWNDGFYSDDFTYITGSATWTVDSADTVVLAAGGNTRHVNIYNQFTFFPNFVTPEPLANEQQADLSWTYTNGPWAINPYIQYTHIPSDPVLPAAGIGFNSASTFGGSLLVGYTFDPATTLAGMSLGGFSLDGRAEYIASTGHATLSVPPGTLFANPLGYGANSKAWELTLTPTYQYKIFYARAEGSYTRINDSTALLGFGAGGNAHSQFRALVEAGFVF
jgi:hypothetical protein